MNEYLCRSRVPDYEVLGGHAVAIAGFSLRLNAGYAGTSGFRLVASNIDKLYVHDDQGGPFARMAFDGKTIPANLDGSIKQWPSMSVTYGGGSLRAIPDSLMVPLYHKVRIPYGRVHDVVSEFDAFVEALRYHSVLGLNDRLEWDIYLITVEDLKSDLFHSSVRESLKRDVLLDQMPKYIWRSIGSCLQVPVVELLFDATDIEQGKFFVRAIEHDAGFSAIMRAISKIDGLSSIFQHSDWRLLERVFSWFKDQPAPIL